MGQAPITQKADRLLAAIQALPPERVAVIEDFVAFIAAREQLQALLSAAATSEASFAAIWKNPDDRVYDAI